MSTLASNDGMNWQDSVKAEFGNSGDLKIYHESGINYIYGGGTNFPTVFMTSATERVRIKGDGQTNIGTGATTIAKFCLTGASNGGHQIVGQASNSVAALDVYSQHGNDANKLSFAVSDNRTGSKSNAFAVKGSGKVGIGTDLPLSLLTVAADSASAEIELKRTNTNTTGAIGAVNWTAIDGHSVANIAAYGDGNDEGAHLIFKTTSAAAEQNPYGTGTVERLRIGSDGDTTITHDTTTKLVSNGTSCNLRLQTSNTGATTGDGLAIQVDSSSNVYFHNYENGDMYFGTNNTTKATFGKNREIQFTNSTITERMHYDSGAGMQNDYNHDTMSYGTVWYGASNAVGTWTFNIRGDGSTAFNDLIDNGTTTTMTMIAGNNSASYYMTAFKIDGTTQTVEWAGGSAPSAGTGSGYDSYVITIFKSSSNTYKCFGNFTNFN